MKPLSLAKSSLILFVIFIVGLLAYHRYSEHQKYENISRFDYLPNDSTIDYSYYNPQILSIYLDNCTHLTSLAKTIWLKGGVDVQTTKTAYGETQSKINKYNSLLRYTKLLEALLSESKDLKDQGYTNDVIKTIQEKDITPGAVENEKDKAAAYDFLKGKNISSHSPPNEIWEMQKLLNGNDYNLNINGVFDAATDSALLDFKQTNNLFPSHICDDLTLKKLAE